MIQVFHMTDKAREGHSLSWLNAKDIVVTIASHTLVAVVDTDDMNEAFMLTNHIDSDWLMNKKVHPEVHSARSTSVGDLFETDNGNFLVDGCGFKQI